MLAQETPAYLCQCGEYYWRDILSVGFSAFHVTTLASIFSLPMKTVNSLETKSWLNITQHTAVLYCSWWTIIPQGWSPPSFFTYNFMFPESSAISSFIHPVNQNQNSSCLIFWCHKYHFTLVFTDNIVLFTVSTVSTPLPLSKHFVYLKSHDHDCLFTIRYLVFCSMSRT